MRLGTPGQRFFVVDFETTGINTVTDAPIEVGIIVCDEHFNLLETYCSLILRKDCAHPSIIDHELPAYRVHGITPDEQATGQSQPAVALAIESLAKKHTRTGRKPVLVSDNIQFEWAFMGQLLGSVVEHFHYCGWDTSLLLEATGVGDPKPAHRALADAGLLHAAIIKALDRTRRLGK